MDILHLYRQLTPNKSMSLSIICCLFSSILSPAFSAKAYANPDGMFDRDYVRLTNQDGGSANDHPVNISSLALKKALATLETAPKRGYNKFISFGESKIIFNEENLAQLGTSIVRLLSQARSNQDVIFHITERHSALFGTRNPITTARVFFSNGKLNIIFGEIHADLEKKYIRSGGSSRVKQMVTQDELRDFHLQTGSRKKPNSNINLTPKKGIAKVYKGRGDWISIDLDQTNKPFKINQSKGNIIDTRKPPVSQQTKQPNEASIENRLIRLKKLYSKGIITEPAYNKRMQEILNGL